jgi:hypothetical protein
LLAGVVATVTNQTIRLKFPEQGEGLHVLAVRPQYRLDALTNATSLAGLRKKSVASACITLLCSPNDWNSVAALSE